MCIATNELFIYDTETARDFLRAHGIDDYQHNEFAELIADEDSVLDKYEALQAEFKSYELSLDAAQNLLNEVLNLCSELKSRQRSAQGARALQSVYDLVYNSEVI